jgi:hypothetical protein
MKYRIEHYYGKVPPIPEANEVNGGMFEIEIDNLQAFVEKHGNIILSPPDKLPFQGHWFIWVTDSSGKFKAK